MFVYKIDVLQALIDNGFSTYRIRKEKIVSESTLTHLRNKEMIGLNSLDEICNMLRCQPSDIIKHIRDKRY